MITPVPLITGAIRDRANRADPDRTAPTTASNSTSTASPRFTRSRRAAISSRTRLRDHRTGQAFRALAEGDDHFLDRRDWRNRSFGVTVSGIGAPAVSGIEPSGLTFLPFADVENHREVPGKGVCSRIEFSRYRL